MPGRRVEREEEEEEEEEGGGAAAASASMDRMQPENIIVLKW
jgi:hypothetical protein